MDLPRPEIDHYTILGLPSGEEGAKLTILEISKAYKQKALILHPDKNPNDPKANDNFTQLKSSYEILKHESSRKLFDDLLKIRREKVVRDRQLDAKRRRMVSDLEERERGAAGFVDPEREARAKEEKIKRKLDDEVRRIREMLAKKGALGTENKSDVKRENGGNVGLDKSKVLKVSWEGGVNGDYSAEKLRELFQEFGEVEDVVIRKKRSSALVVMSSKEGVVAATGVLIGDLSNPLLVLPLQPVNPMASVRAQEPVATKDETPIGNVVGAGYQAFENSVLEKLKKAAQKQK
ncbi:uncharacterized protein LOC141648257 [Silene latifolia]|uniref:uncharacterized protein LOC141648257 n=1 Tax=Silene latifolia TaxID=37657 RepID=UPI003D76BE83